MSGLTIHKGRALAKRAVEKIASLEALIGCAAVIRTLSGPESVLVEGSLRAQTLIDLYLCSGLLNSDPILRTALDVPGTYRWKIPTHRDESLIWCDAAANILKAHRAVGSSAGFWLSYALDNAHVAYCMFGSDEAAQSEETVLAARKYAGDFNGKIDQALQGLTEVEQACKASLLLSKREMEVAKRLASGMSQQEAAHDLQITARTVAFHLQNMKRKLGLKSTVEVLLEVQRSTNSLVVAE
jgi:DNA-binding CsgD family transcriptional regulator